MYPDEKAPEILTKPYNPTETEKRIYDKWLASGFFSPEKMIEAGLLKEDAEAFTIVLPPPNVTGVLHMGHALMVSWQDLMIRFARMRGKRALWIPGTDHAAIATQSKVEAQIKKEEGKSRHDLGREEMLKRIDAFAQKSHDTIVSQVKAMGASCDWSREAFTMDNDRNLAVRTIFSQMYKDGLIYRGNRIVNWDPKGQTTIADDEIVYEERKAKMYTFKYSKDFPISISTTRPETKIGDVAVAVNPEDTRYSEFVGREYDAVFCGVPIHIKIIADKEVDKDFGTGALGVTPAHSMTDWEIADRHDLPRPQVINEYAKMTVGGENILGKKTTEAREVIVEWLRAENLLEKEEEIAQNISTAERTGGIIEPLPKLQWFIAVNKEIPGRGKTLKDIMREPVASGAINILPDHFDKTYFHWIDNLRDWCISRQIWYGHRIPVWYRSTSIQEVQDKSLTASKEEIFCGTEAPAGGEWTQDEDTLDTWFSSGLWTFSTLGWPNKTKELEIYHPTTVIQPGTEILFFWVARMILMTGYALDTIPFKTVLLNGIVRDSQGRKFSKSLGNGGDPIETAQKYGADAIRMYFAIATTPGTDTKLYEDKIKGYKHFANKLWNITRFVIARTDTAHWTTTPAYTGSDQTIRDEFDAIAQDVTKDIESYRFYLAGEKLYHYIWSTFADTILEGSKLILDGADADAKQSRQILLATILRDSIKLLHPFMPFVTEELWSLIPHNDTDQELLMVSKWPVA